MKKTLFALITLLSVLTANAQQENDSIASLYEKQNE
jgi:hypothetical protein